jgi:hypothetical protein
MYFKLRQWDFLQIWGFELHFSNLLLSFQKSFSFSAIKITKEVINYYNSYLINLESNTSDKSAKSAWRAKKFSMKKLLNMKTSLGWFTICRKNASLATHLYTLTSIERSKEALEQRPDEQKTEEQKVSRMHIFYSVVQYLSQCSDRMQVPPSMLHFERIFYGSSSRTILLKNLSTSVKNSCASELRTLLMTLIVIFIFFIASNKSFFR